MSLPTAVDWIRDFLAFQVYITPTVLLVVYYAGALLIPVLIYIIARRLQQRLARKDWKRVEDLATPWLSQRGRIIAYAAISLVLAELGWRMLFEFLIAYFQMHEALTRMSGG
jgi:hypothetical protein